MDNRNSLATTLCLGNIKYLLLILLTVVLIIAIPQQRAYSKEVVLDTYTSGLNTEIYQFYFAPLNILQKCGSWVKLSPAETSGTQYNIEYLAKLDPSKASKTIINTSSTGYWLAREGKAPYTRKHTNLRIIAGFSIVSSTWMTLDSNMKQLPKDFVGKRLTIFPTKFAHAPFFDVLLDNVWGIKDKAKYTRMFFGPAADALRDGLVDAILIGTLLGKGKTFEMLPALQEVSLRHKIYPLSIPEADMEKVAKITGMPLRIQKIPAGTYTGQTEPVNGMRLVSTVMTCDASVDEEVVYELVKTLGENADRFSDYVPYGSHITPRFMFELCPVREESEIHPGALKYYREKGFVK